MSDLLHYHKNLNKLTKFDNYYIFVINKHQMKIVRIIANILFYVSKVLSIFYLIITVYASTVLLLYRYSSISELPVNVDKDGFEIFYPFTKTPFLLGDYDKNYLLSMLLFTTGYAVFLWLLADVFNAFRQQKLFIKKGVLQLSRFYIFNLCVPLLILIFFAITGLALNEIFVRTFLHVVIGIFAFFMAAIFKQGLVLQEEQDLTL